MRYSLTTLAIVVTLAAAALGCIKNPEAGVFMLFALGLFIASIPAILTGVIGIAITGWILSVVKAWREIHRGNRNLP